MKYTPLLPRKNENISHNHPLFECILLCSGLLFILLILYFILGLLVDTVTDRVSPETEGILFAGIGSHLNLKDGEYMELQQRLQHLVDSLQRCARPPYTVRIHMVESDEANAIALPGGNIAVFTGLLQTITSENGLAFVLAHELGHFNNRDHLRSLGRGLILYLLSSMLTSGDSTLSSLLLPSSIFSQARYSQSRESLADRTALDTLNCHYGHTGGALEFFHAHLQSEKGGEGIIRQSFASHPQLQKRITDLQDYNKEQGYALQKTKAL